jgi:hypothetical protein
MRCLFTAAPGNLARAVQRPQRQTHARTGTGRTPETALLKLGLSWDEISGLKERRVIG